jgi:hypothetical protein
MMDILHKFNTFHLYLIRRHFYIKTNRHSLKYFLEQKLLSLEKHKWVAKMQGYDYQIIYNKGKENYVVVDDLSRKYDEEGSLFSLSLLVPNWLNAEA